MKTNKTQPTIYQVQYEINGKKFNSEYIIYDWERIENKFPTSIKIISIKEKYDKVG